MRTGRSGQASRACSSIWCPWHGRKVQVQQHAVGAIGLNHLQGCGAIVRTRDGIAIQLQPITEHTGLIGIIFDNQ